MRRFTFGNNEINNMKHVNDLHWIWKVVILLLALVVTVDIVVAFGAVIAWIWEIWESELAKKVLATNIVVYFFVFIAYRFIPNYRK